jgi:SNF2 family DNA or RNA helicase
MFVAIKSLKSDFRLALSGTPIENHLGELWSIFSFLMPGFLHNQTPNNFFILNIKIQRYR